MIPVIKYAEKDYFCDIDDILDNLIIEGLLKKEDKNELKNKLLKHDNGNIILGLLKEFYELSKYYNTEEDLKRISRLLIEAESPIKYYIY